MHQNRALQIYNNNSYNLKKYNHNMPSEPIEFDNEDKVSKLFNRTSILLNLIKMIFIGIGLVLFTVGILYLTIYRYHYSFTIFSIDMMAGIFISVGCILIVFALASLCIIKPDRNQQIVILYAFFSFIFFILLFVLGVIGLSMNSNGEFSNQIRSNMISVARRYDDRNPNSHVNRKIDWLQTRFVCCGVDSYGDWRTYLRFYQTFDSEHNRMPIKYVDNSQIESRYPYIDDVPDSCCVTATYNCGKNMKVFGMDRSSLLNTKGCLLIYSEKFSNDLVFICSLSLSVSIIVLFLCILLFFAFSMIKKNQNFLRKFARNYIQEQDNSNIDYLLHN